MVCVFNKQHLLDLTLLYFTYDPPPPSALHYLFTHIGIDLVARVIPVICARYPNVHFIVGGDGNKKLLLEEMREKCQLHDRVELLGGVPHAQVSK